MTNFPANLFPRMSGTAAECMLPWNELDSHPFEFQGELMFSQM